MQKFTTVQPKLMARPAFTVVGLLLHTRAMSPEIPALWDRFIPRIGEIGHLAEPHVSYGLMGHFDQDAGTMDYMAGCAVVQDGPLPAGMTRWDVPANTYAVIETTLPGIGEAFDYIYNTWLPSSGYRQVEAPYFECYGEAFSPDNPVLEIYIPVKK